jgi:hypothetical protein
LRLVETGIEGLDRSVDVMVIDRPDDLGDIAALGLTLAQGKQLVAQVQQALVAVQRGLPRDWGSGSHSRFGAGIGFEELSEAEFTVEDGAANLEQEISAAS